MKSASSAAATQGRARAWLTRLGWLALVSFWIVGVWLVPGCAAKCPPGTLRVGNSCDVGLDAGHDAAFDAAPTDPCPVCDQGSEFCFETACYPLDTCGRTLNVPCFAFGPSYLKADVVGTGDRFGIAVSMSRDGTRAAVGVSHEDSSQEGKPKDNNAEDAGAVIVFRRGRSDWVQEAYLKASNVAAGDHFGGSVSLDASGTTLAIGARNESDAKGAVYIFRRTGETWMEEATLRSVTPAAGDQFGTKVALNDSGTVLTVGARNEGGSGAAYVFADTGTSWRALDRLVPSDPDDNDFFGDNVAIDGGGSRIVVAARWHDGPSNEIKNAGAVYVFSRSGDVWNEEAILRASNSNRIDQFGMAVDVSQDGLRIVVGALDGDTEVADTGAAYVFDRIGKEWSEVQRLAARNAEYQDGFGPAVSISGDGQTIAVGSWWEDSSGGGLRTGNGDNDTQDSGAIYLFRLDGERWSDLALIKSADPDVNDGYGGAIDLDEGGKLLFAGDGFEDGSGQATGTGRPEEDNSVIDSGAVFVYRLRP